MSNTFGSNKLRSLYHHNNEDEPRVTSSHQLGIGTIDDINDASVAHLNTFDKLDDEI